MAKTTPCSVQVTPLRIGRSADGHVVVIHCPDGGRIALTADAAALSANLLGRSAAEAGRERAALGNVAAIPCVRVRPLAIIWRNLRARRRRHPVLRWIVALFLLPLVWGTLAGAATTVAALLGPPTQALRALPWLLIGATLLAPVLAWLVTPLLMAKDELRPVGPARFTPRLVNTR